MYTPLPTRPDIDQLKLRARELRDAVAAGNAQANLRVHRQRWPVPQDPVAFPLRNAQSVIAREHGFTNWARLKQYIDGRILHHQDPDPLVAWMVPASGTPGDPRSATCR